MDLFCSWSEERAKVVYELSGQVCPAVSLTAQEDLGGKPFGAVFWFQNVFLVFIPPTVPVALV